MGQVRTATANLQNFLSGSDSVFASTYSQYLIGESFSLMLAVNANVGNRLVSLISNAAIIPGYDGSSSSSFIADSFIGIGSRDSDWFSYILAIM